MKKYIITIIIALGMIINVSAQGDGFFTSNYSNYEDRTEGFGELPGLPGLPGSHGSLGDYNAVQETPISGGLLLLAGMGIAYGIRRRTKE